MSTPSRRIFNQLLFEGNVFGQRDAGRETSVLWDLCRCFHPTREAMNTCWDTKRNTRPANNGSRIDYVLCSDGLKNWFVDANIQEGLMGSDHCPVFATLADRVAIDDGEVALADLMNPRGMFEDGKRVREWSQKDVLPLSAKLIPEFDRRQSIRDMFFKKPTANAPAQSPLGLETCSGTEEHPASQRISSSLPCSSDPKKSITTSSDELSVTIRDAPVRSPQKLSQLKRSSKSTDGSSRSAKRAKPGADLNGKKAKTNTGQRTLQGFFRPVMSSSGSPEKKGKEAQHQDASAPSGPSTQLVTSKAEPEVDPPQEPSKTPPPKDGRQLGESPDRVFDPIEAKESWSKLLGKRLLPRCDHDEPCISLVTKKPGVNCGKFLWELCGTTPELLSRSRALFRQSLMAQQDVRSTYALDLLGRLAKRKKDRSGDARHLSGAATGTALPRSRGALGGASRLPWDGDVLSIRHHLAAHQFTACCLGIGEKQQLQIRSRPLAPRVHP